MKDNWNAFIHDQLNIEPTSSGKLTGLKFAVKDVYEIKNYSNHAGNPDWYRTHQPGSRNAPIIDQLLQQGAFLRGMTHTDELMYSLNGENVHYGTPVNPSAPDRIPGGSSSGSAVAVASGLVDFALGTDTGGSVRIPSAYCGLYGFRPTHGVVNLSGVIPLASSFDTVGWMTRDPELLYKIGTILVQQESAGDSDFSSAYFEEEAWTFVDEVTKESFGRAFAVIQNTMDSQSIKVSMDGLTEWSRLFRSIQGIEIWTEHGEWIEKVHPTFGPDIASRFQWASSLQQDELHANYQLKEEISKNLSKVLEDDGLLVLPTAPGEAPLRGLSEAELEEYRSRTMQLTCIAGLSGCPQITIPFINHHGLPIGLSFIANRYQDLKLLNWARRFVKILEERK